MTSPVRRARRAALGVGVLALTLPAS
ncbi:MAG: hypothetical protein QOC54_2493, partial [Baekduia sp.]|nr:hypothetical protein [Baekduia sp.]